MVKHAMTLLMVGPDIQALKLVDEAYLDRAGWIKKSVRTTAKMGKFSSDRAIMNYADEYWNIEPCKVAGS